MLLAQKQEQRRHASPQRLAGAALLQQLQAAQAGRQAAEPLLQAPPSLQEALGGQQSWRRPQLPPLGPGHPQQPQEQLQLQRQAAGAGLMQQLIAAGALPGDEQPTLQPTLLRGSVPNLPPAHGLQVQACPSNACYSLGSLSLLQSAGPGGVLSCLASCMSYLSTSKRSVPERR